MNYWVLNDISGSSMNGQRYTRQHFGRRGPFLVPLLLAAVTLNYATVRAADPCTLCINGPEETPFPERKIAPDDQAPANTCGFLQDTVGFVDEESPYCVGIRATGTICGCDIPPGACHLCWDGSAATKPDLELQDYPATRLIPPPAAPPGVLLSCAQIESFLHTIDNEDTRCPAVQQGAGERCGCPPMPGIDGNLTNTTVAPVDTNTTTTTPPFVSTDTLCTVCPGGQPILYPEKAISLGDLPISSCADLDLFAGLLSGDSEDCSGLQALGTLCGCPLLPDACSLCPNGEAAPFKNRRLNWFETYIVDVPVAYQSVSNSFTCELLEAITASNAADLFGIEDALFCISIQLKSSICGCSVGWVALTMTWGFRCSGFLSLLGSTLIIIDILQRRKNEFSTYNHLMLGISVFDGLGSIFYMMSSIMLPHEAGFYQSLGNETTCRAQAILLLIGQTSIYYNMALSFYYLLVICYGWKERQFRRLHKWTHVTVIAVGMSLSFSAYSYVGAQLGICGILEPPVAASLLPAAFFVTIPISIVLLTSTANMIIICWKVYQQQRAVQRWMAESNMALTRKVFWQAFWYILAFYITLPCLLLTYNLKFPTRQHYEVNLVFLAFLAPSQGFLNFLVYFHRSTKLKALKRICCSSMTEGEERSRRRYMTSWGISLSRDSLGSFGRRRMQRTSTSPVEGDSIAMQQHDDDVEGAAQEQETKTPSATCEQTGEESKASTEGTNERFG